MAGNVCTDDRKNQCPVGHLVGFQGVQQNDGYNGFQAVAGARADASVTLAFCWSHMRRHSMVVVLPTNSLWRRECLCGFGLCRSSKPRSAANPPSTGGPYARK